MAWFPLRPKNLEDSRIRSHLIQEQILKTLYIQGTTRGLEFAASQKLPYTLIDSELRLLRENFSINPVGGGGVGGYENMDFALTKQGREYASELYKQSTYIGPIPVHMDEYVVSVKKQRLHSRSVKSHNLEAAFSDVVVSRECLNQLGPAINSGGPLFLYGKPGNGKTVISERLARIFRQGIFVPYAIQVDGQIIQFFDEKVHKPVPDEMLPAGHPAKSLKEIDPRWVYVFRPFITVGGELTLEMLDLIFRDGQHCYEAPFQLKANCGVLLVDDFGRQIVKPKDFLNRWIYPLEKGVDFLTLVTGKKIEVPFEQVLIFSTNLNPQDLADEAFWRRIKYKIEIPNPTEAQFKEMFQTVCKQVQISFDEMSFKYMISQHYKTEKRDLRAVHARDILNRVKDHIYYNGLENKLSPEILGVVCRLYFGDVETHTAKAWDAA